MVVSYLKLSETGTNWATKKPTSNTWHLLCGIDVWHVMVPNCSCILHMEGWRSLLPASFPTVLRSCVIKCKNDQHHEVAFTCAKIFQSIRRNTHTHTYIYIYMYSPLLNMIKHVRNHGTKCVYRRKTLRYTKITNQPATSTSQVTLKRKTYGPKSWLYNQLSRYDLN